MNCEWFHRSYWKLLALLHLMLFRLHFYDFYVIRFHVIIPLCMIRRRDGKLNLKNHHQSRFTFVRFSALDSTPKHNPLIVIAKGNYKSELPNPFRELFFQRIFLLCKNIRFHHLHILFKVAVARRKGRNDVVESSVMCRLRLEYFNKI